MTKKSSLSSCKKLWPSLAHVLVGFTVFLPPLSAQDKDSAPSQTEATEGNHSFFQPVGDFLEDSILRPKTPFELVPGKDPNGWGFAVEPYLWLTGLQGRTGVDSLPPINIGFNARTVLQHLDWGIMSKAEVRKGRWGLIADGFYAELSGSGTSEGPLYKSGDLVLQQAFVSLALAYRIIDDRRGYLDFYAGARYNYLGIDIDLETDSGGISDFSAAITDRVAGGVDDILTDILGNLKDLSADELTNLAESALSGQKLEDLADAPDAFRKVLGADRLGRILSVRNPLFAEYISTQADAKVAAAQGRLTGAIQARADAAKTKLSKELASALEDALPIGAEDERWWIDPIVGLRGQINITRWLFLAAQGDVGGFGVGSQITWNVQASIGVNFTRNVYAELGYRYMYVDYDHDNFLYQMNTFGVFSSVGVRF